MNRFRSFGVALALSLGSLSAVACGGTVEQPQTQASAGSKAPVAPNTHGVVKMFGEALGEVSLRPEQRAELEKLASAADARHAAMAEGKKELALALADQVERGSIDRTALQPKIDRIQAEAEKSRPEDAAALAKVHALLDADQRNALADALQDKFKGKGRGKHAGKHGGMRGLAQLTEDLKLTDDQRTAIKEALKSKHEGAPQHDRKAFKSRGEGKKALESFRSPTFDPSKVAPPPEQMRERVSAGTTRMLTMAETVLPILTPEQRKIAADKLRTMASSGAEMPFAR